MSARPQRIAACASIAVLLGTSAYCGVGYLKFKHLAGSDRTAAERAERANADLQTALDRMRNELAQTQARVEIVNDEAKRQVAAFDQGKSDRVAQLTRTLEQAQRDLHLADAQRATLVARLSKEAAEFADGRTKQSQAESGLDQLARIGFATLGLQTYLTAGPKETRAWTIRKGATAPEAAGVIHTDFQRGFIKAEIVSYDDLVAAGSMNAAKAAGKVRMEGKDYVMADGDVVEFRFNL